MKEFPPFRLDSANQCLWRVGEAGHEERILLTPKAFAVLTYLVEHAGRLVTHDELLDSVWAGSVVEPQAVKKHILDVRSALGDRPKNSVFIETVTKRGYRFIAPVSQRAASNLARPGRGAQVRLVGRDRALDELHEHLQDAANGERQIVFIIGEPGVGKTALVDEFRRQVASSALSTRIAQGQCVEGYGGKEAYYAMLDALGRLCAGPQGSSIVEILAAQAPTWLVQFPALLRREHRETLQREILGATRERMLREIGEALETITAEVPLLLIFEDLQWVDHATVDFISAVARRRLPAKLMLVAACRPLGRDSQGHPLTAVIQDLLVHRLSREIVLAALSEAEVEAYLAARSSATGVPAGLSTLLHRHSEGNPLFMVAALDHMMKRGLISLENGRWQLRVPLEQIELDVPDDLRRMIEAHLEHLDPGEQSALELASIVGASFSAPVIGSAANVDPQAFEDRCEELSRRHQIVRWAGTKRFPDGTQSERYEFVHALYRQALYDRQVPSRRARLHQRIGERLEVMYAQDLDEVVPELAHHFEAACDWPRVVEYLQRAAEIARRRYALAQSNALLLRALDLISKLPEAGRAIVEIKLLEKLASNRTAVADIHAIETYEELAARAAGCGMIDVQVRALIDLSKVLAWISLARSLEALQRALRLAAEQDPLMRARTRASCAFRRLWIGGWNAQVAQECREALAEIRRHRGLVLTSHLTEDSFIHWMCAEYREAHRLAVESRSKLFEESGENPYLSTMYYMCQTIAPCSLLFLGEWGEALREFAAGIALAEKNGASFYVVWLRLLEAEVHMQAMDYRGVLAMCESALPVARDAEGRAQPDPGMLYPTEFRMALVATGSAAAALGDYERALADFSTVSDDMDRQSVLFDSFLRMPLAAGLTEVWLAKGDWPRARLHAKRLLEAALATEERTWQGLAWDANARVALAELDRGRARDCIEKALSTVQGWELPLAAWRVHATAALLDEGSGELESARSHRDISRATIQRLANSLPPEEPLRKTFLSAPPVSRILNWDL